MIAEFREFIDRGSFIDLAVGFVMGAAVSGVVSSLVERLIMPAIAVVFGEPSFEAIGRFACEAGECAGSVGAVLTAVVNLLLVAVVMFAIVTAVNRVRRASSEPEPEPEPDPDDPDDLGATDYGDWSLPQRPPEDGISLGSCSSVGGAGGLALWLAGLAALGLRRRRR